MNDFGFFFEEDLNEVVKTVETKAITSTEACVALYTRINTLLLNLEANPDKPTINWPDRAKHVENFRQSLKKILNDAGVKLP